jgi:ARS binding protein 2
MAQHGAHPYSTTPQSTTSTASYASHFRSPLDPAAANQSPGASSYHPADAPRPSQPSAPPTHQQQPETHTPTDRMLPARDFADDDAFEDAYVAFVLYCNPSFPLSVDATELRRNFSSPPKSDGKLFSVTTLFDLLKKLDAKLIKTWTDLALELGVEKPVAGQSSQKVQQYSVRLKVRFAFSAKFGCRKNPT